MFKQFQQKTLVKKMAGINVKLVIMLLATALITITGNTVVNRRVIDSDSSCFQKCMAKCRLIGGSNCYIDCSNACPHRISNDISSNCKINCEKSTCSKFASGRLYRLLWLNCPLYYENIFFVVVLEVERYQVYISFVAMLLIYIQARHNSFE